MSEFKVMSDDEIRDFCLRKDYEIFKKDKEIERLHSIIKEVREYLKEREDDNSMCSVCGLMSDKILEILYKENK